GNRNPDSNIKELEERILKEANSLGIGPMGLGGKTTLLDVKICSTHRHPASYFVDVSYSCWALRRNTIVMERKEYEQ
ncbi:MAG: fumarate hydratase, partial [Candidatus ainarchaeum sp.]|nr:fumarate hydratase [Candidatus ainarchaeum sp.]